jgi:(1->4)-alpha-D-glucan 1-alpha-D-glucosylmutase
LRADWLALTADTLTFDAHVQAARLQLLNAHFGGELDALARALHGCACASEPLSQDISLPAVRRVLLAFLAAFRRYRTASTLAVCSVEDKRVLAEAQTRAQQSLPAPDHALLAQLAHWLGLADPAQDEPEAQTIRRARAMTRFEQLTPPLAAKSVEDTTFYRYAPLLSRNEVGSFPETVAAGVAEFHAANAARASAFPNSLLATATHDHKRGEDQRARLAVLSEIPHEWGALLRRWMAAHAGWRATLAQPGGGVLLAPSPADEIMLYQTLLGAWPPALRADDAPALKAFAARIHMWQEKALREAKTHTSWMLPQADYENSCRAFTSRLLDPAFGGDFLHELQALVDTIAPAALSNSLSQTVLRLTVPGIPDLYQGTEWADFSLVDPDNRRPVDMDARRAALPGLTALPPQPGYARKQQLIAQLLAWRARHAEVFAEGRYQPLQVTGPLARHIVAFARHSPRTNTAVIVLAVRLAWTLAHLPAANRWHGTVVQLSDGLPTSGTCLLTDAPWSAEHGQLRLDDLLDHDSVAVLVGNVEGLPAQTDQKP